jgi:hypothetical protein
MSGGYCWWGIVTSGGCCWWGIVTSEGYCWWGIVGFVSSPAAAVPRCGSEHPKGSELIHMRGQFHLLSLQWPHPDLTSNPYELCPHVYCSLTFLVCGYTLCPSLNLWSFLDWLCGQEQVCFKGLQFRKLHWHLTAVSMLMSLPCKKNLMFAPQFRLKVVMSTGKMLELRSCSVCFTDSCQFAAAVSTLPTVTGNVGIQ